MKRPIAKTVILAMTLLLTACGRAAQPTAADAPGEQDWVMSPVIDAVARVGDSLSVSGHAAPLGRVVISGPGGAAYAAGADDQGRFDLRVPRPLVDTLFVVEARAGQLGYPAPYRLMIAADPSGPIGLLSIGAPTRRLDPAPSLDAIDTDGSATFLSGRFSPGAMVTIEAGQARSVRVAADGRWSLAAAGTAPGAVTVGTMAYAPPPGTVSREGVLERAGDGWRIGWSVPDGARQTTWFPDRR